MYDEHGKYSESIESYIKASNYSKKAGDKSAVARAEANIGIVLRKIKKNREALDYFGRSLEYFKGKHAYFEMVLTTNIGICYLNLNVNDTGLIYEKAAYKLMLDNKLDDSNVYGNLGLAYVKNNDYKKAEELVSKCLERKRKENNDSSTIAVWCENLGDIYLNTGRYKEAVKLLEEAVGWFGENKYLHESTYAFSSLVEAYEKNNDIKNAFKYHKILASVKDSIYNTENSKQINELKEKYQTEKKEAEIKLLTADKALQDEALKKDRAIIISGSVLVVIILIFSIFVYRNYIQKKKINEELVSKNQTIAEQKELVEEKQREIIDSIGYAKRLQQAILPPQNLIRQHLPESFVYYAPKDIIAGDFYWMHHQGDTTFFAVADCTGHGVPGAMVSIVCASALDRTVKEFKITEPGKILDKVVELVIETFEKSESEVKDGMDISFISLIKKDKETIIKWAGANNPLWYLKNGGLEEIKADKQPIGKSDHLQPFTTHTLELSKGDSVYLFTDGYADQFGGPKGKKFKYKQLQDVILANQNKSLSDQKAVLEKTFSDWKGKLEQIDDVCVVGIRV